MIFVVQTCCDVCRDSLRRIVSKSSWLDFDAAGWIFWTVVSLILAGPCVWVAWRIVDPYVSKAYPITIGGIAAVILASFVSTGVNWVLQRRRKRVRVAEKKKSKKSK